MTDPSNNNNTSTKAQYLIKVLVPIPIQLKEQLDKYAYDHDIPVTQAIRKGIACLLELPPNAADTPRRQSNYDKTQAQNERRRKERAISKLIESRPEILQQIHALMQKENADAKD